MILVYLERAHARAHTHTRTHARAHAGMHARTHARLHARTHTRTHTRTHAHTLSLGRSLVCSRLHVETSEHTCRQTGVKTHTPVCMLISAFDDSHARRASARSLSRSLARSLSPSHRNIKTQMQTDRPSRRHTHQSVGHVVARPERKLRVGDPACHHEVRGRRMGKHIEYLQSFHRQLVRLALTVPVCVPRLHIALAARAHHTVACPRTPSHLLRKACMRTSRTTR